MRKTQLAVLSIFISHSLTAFAAETFQTGMDKTRVSKEPPPVVAVVSATRREESIEKITRFVTVITREEIEKSGKRYVMDFLRGQPGVTALQGGSNGRITSVFVRGTNSNMTLVMLDGVQINSPTTGTANLENFTVTDIERIEIVRGPQSVLYGADALGGVINIITKPGKERGLHGDAQFEYGTHETFNESGSLSGQFDKFSFSGAGGRFDSEGPGENDGYQNTTARGHANLKTTENSDLDVAFYYYNALVGIDDGAFVQDPNNHSTSREQVVNSKYTVALTDWWEQYVQYSFFHDMLFSFDPRNPGAGGADPESRFKLDTDRHTVEYQSSFHIQDFDVLTLGYEFEHANANVKRSQASGGFERLARNHGWFLQNELTLWQIWTIVGGIRLDRYDFFGTEANPLFSTGLWIEKTQTKLKGSFGRSIKAPTFNELFFPNFGNTSLQAEKNWGWDAGFEQFYWEKRGSFAAAFFHNDIENLIQFVRVGALTIPENVAQARTRGLELEHKIRLRDNLTFYTNYTYTDAIDKVLHKRLVRRPWHQGKLGLTYDWGKAHFSADWLLVGDRDETSTGPRVKNDGFTKLDFFVSYDITQYLQIYGRVENATNDHYYEVLGFENPSTRFFAGVKTKF